jgi:hypothetical protein
MEERLDQEISGQDRRVKEEKHPGNSVGSKLNMTLDLTLTRSHTSHRKQALSSLSLFLILHPSMQHHDNLPFDLFDNNQFSLT